MRDTLICGEQPQLRSECEITWVKLEVVGAQPLYLAAFYKPKEDDKDRLGMLRNSMGKLIGKKGNIMVVGDFNLPKFTWADCGPSMNQNQNQNQNSLLVKRQNDNTSPGDWPRKISP